jgi:hypothetical protein
MLHTPARPARARTSEDAPVSLSVDSSPAMLGTTIREKADDRFVSLKASTLMQPSGIFGQQYFIDRICEERYIATRRWLVFMLSKSLTPTSLAPAYHLTNE